MVSPGASRSSRPSRPSTVPRTAAPFPENKFKIQNYHEPISNSFCHVIVCSMVRTTKPSINPRIPTTMGVPLPTAHRPGRTRTHAVWICVLCDV